MQFACQAIFASDAVADSSPCIENKKMPPVKKSKHRRTKTFLKEWRKFRDLSQEVASDRLEVDKATLSRIERGESPYNQDFLEKMALAYGCDPSDLLTVNPLAPDPPRLIYDKLRASSPATQERALAILEAFLKAS